MGVHVTSPLDTPSECLAGVGPVPQPSPGINPGGDCFACATLALVRHFWPDEAAGQTVAAVVEWWRTQPVYGHEEKVVGNTISYARRSLFNLPEPFRLEVMTDPWQSLISEEHQPHGLVYGVQNYARRVEAYLSAGWVGLTSIRFAPAAPHFLNPKPEGGYWNASTDHMVLIDGVRTTVQGETEGLGVHVDEVHIVCSVKGGYWIDERDLLREYGGRFIWWCRPRRELPWRRVEAT
jgi:hypothetical protein